LKSVVVIINAGSGQGHDDDRVQRLTTLFERAGASATVHLARSGTDIADLARDALARRPDIVVAGGGDGTISSVAAILAGSDVPLGVLPLGTLNHFAKDLGMPGDVEAAVESIVGGRPTRVDVGEVNGRVFINNASLGLYPDIVRDRERQRKRLGRGKWPALAWASLAALRRFSFMSVRLSVDGRDRPRRTPFVFIGNNAYVMQGFAIGERTALDGGQLSLYVVHRAGRLRLLQLAVRALFGRLDQARDFEVTLATEIVVESRKKQLRVATDGEITLMVPPLRFRVRPASLLVVGGRPAPGATD
jgi:diacylglycerol kinase family enzyme